MRDLPTYTAIVDCLCNFLEEHTVEYGTTESPILPKTRPPGEKKLLATLNILIGENLPAALEAGVVSRWLSKYPFPCLINNIENDFDDSGKGSHSKDIVHLLKTYWPDDALMGSIITTISSNTDGLEQLREYGLTDPYVDAVQEQGEDDGDVLMVNGESTAGRRRAPERRLSLPEESFEEQALRRRRREAMVYSEDGGPFRIEDVIELPDT